ncbi:MAG: hypothetical protein OHK0017_03740 [Patescibacteria group bacterium]
MSNTQLSSYIQKLKQDNLSEEQIYQQLLSEGFKLTEIRDSWNIDQKITEREPNKVNQSLLTSVFVYFGGGLIGLGILSLVASNWSYLSPLFKTTLILGVILLSYLAGLLLQSKKLNKTAAAFFLIANLAYGGGIFLVGQTYNLRLEWPDGFLLWLCGTILAGLVLNNYLLLVLSFIIALFSLSSVLDIYSYYYTSKEVSTLGLMLVGAVLLIITGWILRRRVNYTQNF